MAARKWVITIDGPSGSGKSTAARLLAKRLGYLYLDTGSMYRAVALKALRKGISLKDHQALGILARCSSIVFRPTPGGWSRLFLDGKEVTRAIRQPRISEEASEVATLPVVRRALVLRQQAIGARGGIVAEGRDTGTVVFPKARLKFFLSASPEERARRRLEELRRAGNAATLQQVLRELKRRDLRDRRRRISPLRPASDAIRIDNSRLKSTQTLAIIADYVQRSRRKP